MNEIRTIAQCVHRSCGIHTTPAAFMSHNVMQRAIEMYASFLCTENPTSARLGKRGNKVIGFSIIRWQIKNRFSGSALRTMLQRRADGDVWHEMAVHDVYVQERTPPSERLLRACARIREIRGKDGRRELNRAWQDLCSWTLHSLYSGTWRSLSSCDSSSCNDAHGSGHVCGCLSTHNSSVYIKRKASSGVRRAACPSMGPRNCRKSRGESPRNVARLHA